MRLQDWHTERLGTDAAYAAAVREVDAAQTLADQIVGARVRAGLTQTQLAQAAGLTQPQLSRLEAGVDNPTLETLERVGRALGVRLEFAGVDATAIVEVFEANDDTAFGGREAIYADSTSRGAVTLQTKTMSIESLVGASAANAQYALAA